MSDVPVTTVGQLRASHPPPTRRALEKEHDRLDHHCRDFAARSPMVLLATSGADGSCDVSPRGGSPGFVSDQFSLVVDADEVFLHCAKALIRSQLWEPGSWPDPAERPSGATIFGDHMQVGHDAAAEMLEESYNHRL